MGGEHTLRFVQPWLLLLLLGLIVPFAYWLLRGRRKLRYGIALAIRLFILALLVVALARPQSRLEANRLAVAFTLDVSESVPDAQRRTALGWIRDKVSSTPGDDDAALLVFGDRPSVEVPFVGAGRRGESSGVEYDLVALQSRLSRAHSDLAGAVAFAEATFPPGFARRVVLLSDGNETRGDLISAARALKAAGVQLDVVPLRYSSTEEVRVDALRAPANVVVNEPFGLRLTVTAQEDTDATLQLYENGAVTGDPMKVRLNRGLNVFKLTREFDVPGYYQYEVQVQADRDGNPANNVGRASVLVSGEARVMVCSQDDWPDTIGPALDSGGIRNERRPPSKLPTHPAGYVDYDCVILNNVAAFDLNELQISALDNAVRELGVGLVVVGGNRSYGPGGYRGTPLEALLPVDLDIKNRKTMPKGALVIVLHSIEFDTGNTWAERICKSALNGMEETDDAGIVYYGGNGEQWLFPLAPRGDRGAQFKLIENVQVGDMPSFHRCFVLAWSSLQTNDAAIKHVVVISDGDPQVPTASLLKEMVAGQVTVSTICINPHSPSDTVNMKALAKDGGGRYYGVAMGDDLNRLPSLMLKEAATLRRAAINEKTFTPRASLAVSPMLRGITALPPLQGYVVTAPRAEAETILVSEDEEDPDPILATWQAGLGRCTAFTSDATTRWASDWIGWSGYEAFWLQVTRATTSATTEGHLPLRVEVKGSSARVVVDARDDTGHARSDLDLDALLLGNGPEGERMALAQTSPGRYEGEVEGLEQGHYLLRVVNRDGGAATSLAVFSVDFSQEHRALRSNDDLLAEAAAITGGRVLDYKSDPFVHDLDATLESSELWPWLLLAAALFLIADVPVDKPGKPADDSAMDVLLKAKKRAEDKRKWQ